MAARASVRTGTRHMGLLALVAATVVAVPVAQAADGHSVRRATAAVAPQLPGRAPVLDASAARDRVSAARAETDRAQAELDDASAALGDAQQAVAQIVRRHYERGSLAALAPVLGATSPGDALSALHSYRSLVEGEQQAVRRLGSAQDTYAARSAALDDARARLAAATADLDKAVAHDAVATAVPTGTPPP